MAGGWTGAGKAWLGAGAPIGGEFDKWLTEAAEIDVCQAASQATGCSVILIAACQFSDAGHDWIEVTTIKDGGGRYLCSRCDARGVKRSSALI